MKETFAEEIAGRSVRIIASTVHPFDTLIYFDDTNEMIENCQRIELDIDVEKPTILAKVHLVRTDKARLPDDPCYCEIGETDRVKVDVFANVESVEDPTNTCYTNQEKA